MDDGPDASRDRADHAVRFVPDRRFTALAGLGALVAAALAVFATSGPSRLVAAVATVVLLAYFVGDLVFSPRLEADALGVTVRSPLTRVRVGWDEVDAVRADVRSRYGLRSTTLEVDAGEVLVVLSRRSLGTDPERAAELVNAHRPA